MQPCQVALLVLLSAGALVAQQPSANYDEARVPAYVLPDPLIRVDGSRVTTPHAWRSLRRPELLRLFASHVYGRTPASGAPMGAAIADTDPLAFNGRATRKQVTLGFGTKPNGPAMHLLMYLPNSRRGRVPVFLGLNFRGNQAVTLDPGVHLAGAWLPDTAPGVSGNRATEKTRGSEALRWPVDDILGRGYGLVTAYYGDLDPDFDDGFQNGVQPLFYRPGQSRPDPDEWGAIGAWAWGLSRVLDYLQTEPAVDGKRVAVSGVSRLGKAALWAGAQDQRFAMVVPILSGEGGASISRRNFGETVADLTKPSRYDYWYAPRYADHAFDVERMPVDGHMLVALVAPRPVLLVVGADDTWSDPRGEFIAANAAAPVYALYDKKGLSTAEFPKPDTALIDGDIGFFMHAGGHKTLPADFEVIADFMDRHFGRGKGGIQ